MLKTKNSQTIVQNTLEILVAFDKEKIQAFTDFAKRKRKTPKYLTLFRELILLKEEGITPVSLDTEKLKRKIEGKRGFSKSYSDLIQHLYFNILEFLSKEHFKKDQVQWRIEASKMLDESEALWAMELGDQAAMRLINALELFPKNGQLLYWEDVSIMCRATQMKVMMAHSVTFLTSEEEDLLIYEIMMSARHNFYPSSHRHIDPEKIRDRFQLESQKLLFFNLLYIAGKDRNEYNSTLNAIDKILNQSSKARNAFKGYYQQNKQYGEPKEDFEGALPILHELLWRMLKFDFAYAQADEQVMLDSAKGLLKFDLDQFALGFISIFLIQFKSWIISAGIDANDITNLNGSDSEKKLDKIILASSEFIGSLPERAELNEAIVLFVFGKYAECKEVCNYLLKKKFLQPQIHFILTLCIVEKDDDGWYEAVEKLGRNIPKSESFQFEREAYKILRKGTRTQKGSFRQKSFFELAEEVEKLKELKQNLNPIHSLIIYWFEWEKVVDHEKNRFVNSGPLL